MRRLGNAVFGIAATADQRADAAAQLVVIYALPDGDNFASHLEPGNRRSAQRRRVGTQPLCNVRPVDPGIGDLDQHFALAGLRNWQSLWFQHLWAARRIKADRGHL